MPGPFNHHAADGQRATILWLPKSNDRSVIVASELRQAGFFDMNRHFLSLLTRDRKSVVQGKSVAVRVDLGGRRLFKKTKSINTETGKIIAVVQSYIIKT